MVGAQESSARKGYPSVYYSSLRWLVPGVPMGFGLRALGFSHYVVGSCNWCNSSTRELSHISVPLISSIIEPLKYYTLRMLLFIVDLTLKLALKIPI